MKDDVFTAAKTATTEAVAAALGIETKRGSRKKAPCLVCDSSDAMHLHIGESNRKPGAHCFSCGTHFTIIDLASAALGYDLDNAADAAKAARWICEALRIPFDDDEFEGAPSPEQRQQQRDQLAEARRRFDESRNRRTEDAADYRDRRKSIMAAYAKILDAAHLPAQDARAAEYLRGRGLNLDLCEMAGVRFVDGRADWKRITDLVDSRVLKWAGLEHDRYGLHPWTSWPPFLIFPYDSSRGVEALRFRRIEDDDSPKLLSVLGTPTNAPFPLRPLGYELIFDLAMGGEIVFIVEGEIDAISLMQVGFCAVATGGSGAWSDAWTRAMSGFSCVVVGDCDDAGRKMIDRISGTQETAGFLPSSMGAQWPGGIDANDLLQDGKLERFAHHLIGAFQSTRKREPGRR